MAKLNLSLQLDAAIEALLARGDSFVPAAGAELAPLVSLALDLRGLPRESFRERLKKELERRTEMATNATPAVGTSKNAAAAAPAGPWKRAGFRTVTPYLIVADASKFMEFLKAVFGAEEKLRVGRPDGSIMHAEARIGESMIEMATASEQFPPRPMPIHVYVRDVDAAYARALAAGATSLRAPADQEYGDRDCSVRDAFGNNWYIGAALGASPIPAEFPDLMPYLHADGAQAHIDYMKAAFGAEEIMKAQAPDGTIVHAKMRFGGDAVVELSEARAEFPPMPGLLHIYVVDADAAFARALTAGGKVLMAVADQPYGERNGTLVDPFGNLWTVATHVREVKF